jgi:hypothetical protein
MVFELMGNNLHQLLRSTKESGTNTR